MDIIQTISDLNLFSQFIWALFNAIIILMVSIGIVYLLFKTLRKIGNELPSFIQNFILNKMIDSLNIETDIKNAQNVQEIAATQIQLLKVYYNNTLKQSERSFAFALLAAAIALIFFMLSIGLLLSQLPENIAIVTSLGGALSGFVSAVNFYLYNKASIQLSEFYKGLNSTQDYLFAENTCDKLDEPLKSHVRADLIRTLVGIPSLSNLCDKGDEKG